MKVTSRAFVKEQLPKIEADFHKYDRGRLLLVCGAYGMAGACIMAARAALRTGCGFIDLAIPASIYPMVTQAVPEAVCTVYDETDASSMEEALKKAVDKADAVAVGSGLGALRDTVCPIVLKLCDEPLLIDADGLNYLSSCKEITLNSPDLVLTPHEGEAARLFHTEASNIRQARQESAEVLAKVFHASVLLKGLSTVVAREGEESFVNSTGNAGLARAGSGDVLTGIIGSLMAQGMKGFYAAACGAFLHGLAGDRGCEKIGLRSLLPTDVIELIPEVLQELEK